MYTTLSLQRDGLYDKGLKGFPTLNMLISFLENIATIEYYQLINY